MPRWQDHEEYFWGLVKRKSGNACWEWQGGLSKGYGRVWKDGRRQAAHRVSYEYKVGPIPNGMFACHKCDNRKCVRPSHIFIGTHADNMKDCTKKGRNTLINNPIKGDGHWTKKIDYRKKFSNWMKRRHKTGAISIIRDKKGRILGTKCAS